MSDPKKTGKRLVDLHNRAVKSAMRYQEATTGTETKQRLAQAMDRADDAFLKAVADLYGLRFDPETGEVS